MKRILASMAYLFIVCVGSLASHDFWLIPNAFRIVPGTEVIVFGQTSSTFPTTLSAVTPDRIARARLVGAQASEDIQQLDVSANSLRLVHRPRLRGQALVTAMVHPRSILESPESFRRYLELEGAPEALARYEREGLLPTDSITRRYAKYAKTLIEVGEAGLPVYQRIAGHPLEFVPLDDPARISAGDSLRFQMLLFGEPVPEARGHASVAGSLDRSNSRT